MTDQQTNTERPTLLDEALPDPDYTLIEHIVLPVTADVAYDAIGSLDLTDVRDPVTRAALCSADCPNGWAGASHRAGRPA
jgi:hypothetical protein